MSTQYLHGLIIAVINVLKSSLMSHWKKTHAVLNHLNIARCYLYYRSVHHQFSGAQLRFKTFTEKNQSDIYLSMSQCLIVNMVIGINEPVLKQGCREFYIFNICLEYDYM